MADEAGQTRTAPLTQDDAPGLIGMVVLDILNPFFVEGATAVETRLQQENLILAVSSSREDPLLERRTLRAFARAGARGILLTPAEASLDSARQLVEDGTPVVLFASKTEDPHFSNVFVDDSAGAEIAMRHLLDLGHRDILFINGPEGISQSKERLRGVREATRDLVKTGDLRLSVRFASAFAGNSAAKVLREELVDRGGVPPTAIFAANDVMALGALTTLAELGFSVPEDVSIVGYDDIPPSARTSTPLTTIRQPMRELAKRATDLLVHTPDEVVHERFEPKLEVRASTAPPRPVD